MTKKFVIPVQYTFNGYIEIESDSEEAAMKIAENDVVCNFGNISSTYDDTVSWDISPAAIKKFPGLVEDNFDEIFKPVKNHIDTNAAFNGCMFETFGAEKKYVTDVLASNPETIWTIVENDGIMSYAAGFHYVNAIGYLITEKKWVTGIEDVILENVDDEDKIVISVNNGDEIEIHTNVSEPNLLVYLMHMEDREIPDASSAYKLMDFETASHIDFYSLPTK